jgi:hypothetical protein
VKLLVYGGYGTFGSLVAAELSARGATVTIAGRDAARAQAAGAKLGGTGIAADVSSPDSQLLRSHAVVVNCAGPFSSTALAEACLAAGIPHVDLADDRAYVAAVRALDERFRARRLAAAVGCSSLPALSGALALAAAGPRRPTRVRATLFIGNRNPKGAAAIRSAVGVIGRPVAAPQGTLRGFSDGECVKLPHPFGARKVYTFDSPEYDLFPPLLGAREVTVKVGFESRLATGSFALLARLGGNFGDRTAALFTALGRLSSRGNPGGAILVELGFADGTHAEASLVSPEGQRMAALPCALAALRLAAPDAPPGVHTAYELLGARPLLSALEAAGATVT